MRSSPLRVLIADDNPYIREGLAALLSQQKDMCVVAHAANGHEAVVLCRHYAPDVTLMDVEMPLMSGIDAIECLQQEDTAATYLALTIFSSVAEEARALKAGATQYLLKDLPREELFDAIRSGRSIR
jgi:DNA-binding NarL/FixJ family response regulator